MNPETILRLARITMRRDDRMILSGVDWEIRRGEHWALLGANGSGKTSLLKIVAGYEWPSEGSVEVLGRPFGSVDLRELRKSIGWVSSSLPSWFPESNTALEIAASGLEASIGLWREFTAGEFAAAREALESLGGGAILDRPYRVLSQGERQRVLIARALVNRPAILVLDEPCVGIDPAAREDFLADLTNLATQRTSPAMIFVTHHIEEIPPFVLRALLLKEGRTVSQGAMDEVLTPRVLEEAFGRPCEIERNNGKRVLRFLPQPRSG
jgi:iron complex transport system ATP-binding protein